MSEIEWGEWVDIGLSDVEGTVSYWSDWTGWSSGLLNDCYDAPDYPHKDKPERTENRKILVQKDAAGEVVAYGSVAIDKMPEIEAFDENETLLMLHDKKADPFQLMERRMSPADFAKATAHHYRESSISNTDGYGIRYRDGKQECTITIAAADSAAPSTAAGNMFMSAEVTWTFPFKFKRVFEVHGQSLDSTCWVNLGTPTNTSVAYREFSPTSTTAKGVKLTAWGVFK
jgi:hypothetical protein